MPYISPLVVLEEKYIWLCVIKYGYEAEKQFGAPCRT